MSLQIGAIERLVFFGTPDFAVPTFQALVAAGFAPALAVTRPAKPVGRGHELRQPAVARAAEALGVPVRQPLKVSDPELRAELAALAPDVAVVVAYGAIFPKILLDLPRIGCVNLHASLLPRHRGAAPIQATLQAGDEIAGVTTMLMAEGLDNGPILLQRSLPIGPEETAGELFDRLATVGAELMVETLRGLEQGAIIPRAQVDADATYAGKLVKDVGRVDWTLDARTLFNQWRAYTPWPGLAAQLRGEPVKILRAALGPSSTGDGGDAPGTILAIGSGRLRVACAGGGVLDVLALQRPGRRAVPAIDFANGERLRAGERFT